MNMPAESHRTFKPPQPVLVALAAWVVPGLGYFLLRQRSRGITIGVTIILMFVAGLLIGGVRSLEVPLIDRESGAVLPTSLGDEIRNKPWVIAQVFAGPVAVIGGAASTWARAPGEGQAAPGFESYARVNEIAVLYTAVAGMLNLLAMIDSAHRAGRLLEEK